MLKKIVFVAFIGAASFVSFKVGRGVDIDVPRKAAACESFDPCFDRCFAGECRNSECCED
jgi:hypothetical protein